MNIYLNIYDMNKMNVVQTIDEFLQQIRKVYSSRSFKLYMRMLKQHKHKEGVMDKHVALFKQFCEKNNDAIVNKKINELTEPKISFTDIIYIDLTHIFHNLKDTNKVYFWEHLNKIRQSFLSVEELNRSDEECSDDELIQHSMRMGQFDPMQNLLDPMMLFNMMNSQAMPDIAESFQSSGIDLKSLQEPIQKITSTLMQGLEGVNDPNIQAILQMARAVLPMDLLSESSPQGSSVAQDNSLAQDNGVNDSRERADDETNRNDENI